VLAAKRLGAERIILMGRHKDRTDHGREFGATDVVAQRGDEGVMAVGELTRGDGTHTVLECVGTQQAIDMSIDMSIGVARDGGMIGRVGAAQYQHVPMGFDTIMRNITMTGGVAPARSTARYTVERATPISSANLALVCSPAAPSTRSNPATTRTPSHRSLAGGDAGTGPNATVTAGRREPRVPSARRRWSPGILAWSAPAGQPVPLPAG